MLRVASFDGLPLPQERSRRGSCAVGGLAERLNERERVTEEEIESIRPVALVWSEADYGLPARDEAPRLGCVTVWQSTATP